VQSLLAMELASMFIDEFVCKLSYLDYFNSLVHHSIKD